VATHEGSTPAATPTDVGNPETGPLANAGVDLINIYQQFEAQGGGSTFTPSGAGVVEIKGTSVGIDAHMKAGGDFNSYVSTLSSLGMQIQRQDAAHGLVEGLLPIGQLVAAAQNPQTTSLSAVYIPAK
jgi:hypothetical protein